MNKTYKIQLPHNKEAQNIRTNIKDGTIEVEVELKEKWELKDGEIYYTNTDYAEYIFITKKILSDHIATDIILRDKEYLSIGFDFDVFKEKTNLFRPATDSEKQLLFDALAKDGKMWDAEKKQVVDLPKPQAEVKECPTLEKDIDWEERRYEIARQIMDSQLSCCGYERSMIEPAVKFSVECTDALIAELKKGGER